MTVPVNVPLILIAAPALNAMVCAVTAPVAPIVRTSAALPVDPAVRVTTPVVPLAVTDPFTVNGLCAVSVMAPVPADVSTVAPVDTVVAP